jgi:hypothetical protein
LPIASAEVSLWGLGFVELSFFSWANSSFKKWFIVEWEWYVEAFIILHSFKTPEKIDVQRKKKHPIFQNRRAR